MREKNTNLMSMGEFAATNTFEVDSQSSERHALSIPEDMIFGTDSDEMERLKLFKVPGPRGRGRSARWAFHLAPNGCPCTH
ncbi:hypothetical protein [Sphingomonas metalli]|uniref:hypothetical protein n=1 Tax=Sphingomonas metalli TaxID=1779358 RepID=UPI00166B34FB|nr:hypothetical protein [Sphingomonas metalli]